MIYYCCYQSLSHEILSYYVCACRKDDVWTTGNGRNVWLEMIVPCMADCYINNITPIVRDYDYYLY